MSRLLLFSDDEKQFLITDQILKEKCELTWCTYHSLEKNEYPPADAVVMHFNNLIRKRQNQVPLIQLYGLREN